MRREGVDTAKDTTKFSLKQVGCVDGEHFLIRPGYTAKSSRIWYSFNSVATTYEYLVHNSSLLNVSRGIVERVFCVLDKDGNHVRPPKPRKGVFARKMGAIGKRISNFVGHSPQWTRDQFVSSYSGPRAESYRRAASSLDVSPLDNRDAHLTTFVKAEKINCTLKEDPAPRVIQPRSQRYNVEVGRFLKPLEPVLMKAIDHLWGEATAIKGYTVEKVGRILKAKADKYSEPVFVGLDASRFDQHCSREALEWEHGVYNAICHSPYLYELLKWQLDNHGTAFVPDGKIRYQVSGCRMSGDMNTSMGNYLIMSCLVYVYLKEHDISASLANCGDDCVLFMEKRDLHKLNTLPRWFLKMGYTMKVEKPVYILEEIEFCQMHPVYTSRGYIMVRRPDVVLTKDCCVVRGGMNIEKLREWLGSQRKGGLALAGDVPVLSSFYKSFPDVETTMESEYAAPHKFKSGMQYGGITDESRFSFWLAFGLTPDDQLAVEEECSRLSFTVNPGSPGPRTPSLLDYCTRN